MSHRGPDGQDPGHHDVLSGEAEGPQCLIVRKFEVPRHIEQAQVGGPLPLRDVVYYELPAPAVPRDHDVASAGQQPPRLPPNPHATMT